MLATALAGLLAATTPTDGTIAFVAREPAGIEAIATDGTGRHALAPGEGLYHPAWSPGGEQLAYTGGAGELRIVRSDGTGATALDVGGVIVSRPAWSPDGTRIAFTGHRGGNVDLYVAYLEATTRVDRLSDDDVVDAGPTWSPDGSRIAFTRDGALWTITATGGDRRVLDEGPGAATPAWSPDGSRIAYSRDGELLLIPATGGEPVRVRSGARDPAWSPDGTRLAYTDSGVHIVDVASGATRQLVGQDASDPAWSRPPAAAAPFPPPAPDAPPARPPAARRHTGLLAFVSDRDGDEEIFTMNPGGGDLRQLTHNRVVDLDPAWSPVDPNRIAFSRGGSILVMNARGDDVQRLTSGAVDRHPAWSPTGAFIAFTRIPAGRPSEIWLMRTDGRDARRLTPPGQAAYREPAWSASGELIATERIDLSLQLPRDTPDGEDLFAAYGALHYGLGMCTFIVAAPALPRCRDGAVLERSPAWHPNESRLFYVDGSRGYATTILGYVVGDASAEFADGRRLYRDPRRRYDDRVMYGCGALDDLALAPDGATATFVVIDKTLESPHRRIYVDAIGGVSSCNPLTRGASDSFQPSWQTLPTPLPRDRSGRLGKRTNVTVTRRGRQIRIVNRNRFPVTVRAGRLERRVPPRGTRVIGFRKRVRVRGSLGAWRTVSVRDR
jgi:TolB protein